jgi:hypothetical protein
MGATCTKAAVEEVLNPTIIVEERYLSPQMRHLRSLLQAAADRKDLAQSRAILRQMLNLAEEERAARNADPTGERPSS